MYCSACGTGIAPGLSFCNRCGFSLKERNDSNTGSIRAFLIAITLIGIVGLGIMLGGALTLKRDANLGQELVGFFMLFTFLIVTITEILLVRQLSRLTDEPKQIFLPAHTAVPNELSPPQARSLAEPISSVTENTTRTLEYSSREPISR
jgi:predicted nucleic acid-binding Zn ribbon protein